VEVLEHKEMIWNTLISLKMSIFVWRLVQNKLPTKDNLVRRGMTHLSSLLCFGDCGNNESSKQLFFEYDVFSNLCHAVTKWLEIYIAFSIDVRYHALQFDKSDLVNKETQKCFVAI
jgi:hypothetical protein